MLKNISTTVGGLIVVFIVSLVSLISLYVTGDEATRSVVLPLIVVLIPSTVAVFTNQVKTEETIQKADQVVDQQKRINGNIQAQGETIAALAADKATLMASTNSKADMVQAIEDIKIADKANTLSDEAIAAHLLGEKAK